MNGNSDIKKEAFTGRLVPGKCVIGLTGGVGSGKSLILRILREDYGAYVLEADAVCKELIEPDGRAFFRIVSLLGKEILAKDGSIDKAAMSRRIFSDEEARLAVNGILHPATFEEVARRIKASGAALVVYESAIPKEARFAEICDRILYVYAKREIRLERLMRTRGYSREKALSIMHSQMSGKAFRALADGVVQNNAGVEEAKASLKRVLARWGIKGR